MSLIEFLMNTQGCLVTQKSLKTVLEDALILRGFQSVEQLIVL